MTPTDIRTPATPAFTLPHPPHRWRVGVSVPLRSGIESWIWVVWMLILFLVPLITRTPVTGLFGSGRLAYYIYTDFLTVLAFVGLLMRRKHSARRGSQKNLRWVYGLLAVLTAQQYVSLLVTVFRGGTMTLSDMLTGVVWIKIAVIIYVAARVVERPGWMAGTWRVFLASFVVVSAIATLEGFRNPFVFEWLNAHYGTETHVNGALYLASLGQLRATATFDRNPHGLAIYLCLSMILFASAFLYVKRMSKLKRVGLVALLCLAAYNLPKTGTLNGMVQMLVGLAVVIAYRSHRHGLRSVALLLTMCAAAAFTGWWGSPMVNRLRTDAYQIATGGLAATSDSSVRDRHQIVIAMIELIRKDPIDLIFGVGASRVRDFSDDAMQSADNQYVFVLLTIGLIGLAAFVALFAYSLAAIHAKLKLKSLSDPTGWSVALLVATNAFLACLMVSNLAGPFSIGETFSRNIHLTWSLVGLALALDRRGLAQ